MFRILIISGVHYSNQEKTAGTVLLYLRNRSIAYFIAVLLAEGKIHEHTITANTYYH